MAQVVALRGRCQSRPPLDLLARLWPIYARRTRVPEWPGSAAGARFSPEERPQSDRNTAPVRRRPEPAPDNALRFGLMPSRRPWCRGASPSAPRPWRARLPWSARRAPCCSSLRASRLAFRCASCAAAISVLDLDHRPAHDLAAQPRHRGVDHLGALLGDLRQDAPSASAGPASRSRRGPTRSSRPRRCRTAIRRAPVRAAEQHAERAADDPDEQADQAAARGADVGVVPDLALDVDATVGVARDDGSAGDLDLALRIELLEVGERLVGVLVASPGLRRR